MPAINIRNPGVVDHLCNLDHPTSPQLPCETPLLPRLDGRLLVGTQPIDYTTILPPSASHGISQSMLLFAVSLLGASLIIGAIAFFLARIVWRYGSLELWMIKEAFGIKQQRPDENISRVAEHESKAHTLSSIQNDSRKGFEAQRIPAIIMSAASEFDIQEKDITAPLRHSLLTPNVFDCDNFQGQDENSSSQTPHFGASWTDGKEDSFTLLSITAGLASMDRRRNGWGGAPLPMKHSINNESDKLSPSSSISSEKSTCDPPTPSPEAPSSGTIKKTGIINWPLSLSPSLSSCVSPTISLRSLACSISINVDDSGCDLGEQTQNHLQTPLVVISGPPSPTLHGFPESSFPSWSISGSFISPEVPKHLSVVGANELLLHPALTRDSTRPITSRKGILAQTYSTSTIDSELLEEFPCPPSTSASLTAHLGVLLKTEIDTGPLFRSGENFADAV